MAETTETWPGVRVPTLAHTVGWLRPQVARDLAPLFEAQDIAVELQLDEVTLPAIEFGVSALVRDFHGREMAMPSEGGHACFAPGDPIEDEILRILRRRYDPLLARVEALLRRVEPGGIINPSETRVAVR